MMKTQHQHFDHDARQQEQGIGIASETRYRIGSLVAVMLGFELVALITILQAASFNA